MLQSSFSEKYPERLEDVETDQALYGKNKIPSKQKTNTGKKK